MFDSVVTLAYKPPTKISRPTTITPASQYVDLFETTIPPPVKPFETPKEKKQKQQERMKQLNNEKNELLAKEWDPHSNASATE
jgi:hypothetical protein